MATRFAAERYCVQSNNGNVKSPTSKAFAKIKIKCFGKNHISVLEGKMELWESGEQVELLKEAETIQKYPTPLIQHQPSRKY